MITKQRLDKFLFFSRATKSRTLAQKLIESGAVRVNAARTTATDHKLAVGDVLTMTIHDRLLVWRVLDTGARRGPASAAALLYQDLSPPALPRQGPLGPLVTRDAGTGRPTKKQRRLTDRLRDPDPDGA